MYKKFFLNACLLIVPIVAIIALINIKVDSGFIIKDFNGKIAKILVSGKNAGIKYEPSSPSGGNLQADVVKEELRLKQTTPKDILVFGSSRSAEICYKLFPQNTFFNCAMAGGNILDYIAMYGLYKREHLLPKYLIINIDPFTFHSRKPVIIDKSVQYVSDKTAPLSIESDLLDDYKFGMKALGLDDTLTARKAGKLTNLIEFFNPSYFQLNLRYFNSKMVIETDSDYMRTCFTIRKDGSYSSILQSQIDTNWVAKFSKKFVGFQNSEFFISSDTATVYFEYFKKLVLSLKKDGVIPIVYMSPVNPVVYDNLSDNMHVAIEDDIDVFCKQNGILRVGSLNPHKYGYDRISNFWRDGYHPVQSVVNNVFHYHEKELKNIGIVLNQDRN